MVADHQRRAPRHARPRGDVRPERLLHLRRRRAGRARDTCSAWRCARWTCRSGAWSTRRVLTPRRRLPLGPHDHAARRRALPRGHRRRCTAWPTSSGSPTTAAGRQRAVTDLTSAWCTLGLWGPRARDVLAGLTSDDVSHEGFPFARCRTIEIGPLRVLALRISYVGDLGWELHVPIEQGARLWDTVWEAGEPHGVVPAGIGVYGTTGRIEKGYRAFGFELDARVRRRRGRHGLGQGQGPGLRRPRGARAPPRAGSGRDPVHADRRRPHVRVRRAGATCWAASRS